MTVVRIKDAQPPGRDDFNPWAFARIQETPAEGGPWTQIDRIELLPRDSNPARPQVRGLTSQNGTLDDALYRVIWEDEDGDLSRPTDPVSSAGSFSPYASALARAGLTVEELKQRIEVERSTDDELLESFLLEAFEQAQASPPHGTGRQLTPLDDPAGEPISISVNTAFDGPVGIVARRPLIDVPDAREIVSVAADGLPLLATGYRAIERNGYVVRLRLAVPARVVTVVGRFGFLRLPESLKSAIYTLAGRMYFERNVQYADQVASDDGTTMHGYFRQLPPRTKLVFASFAGPHQNVRLQ